MNRKLNILLVILILFSITAHAETWDTKFDPGDLVCLYDIGKWDPLIDNESNDSLKYWYRSPVGNQQSNYQLRPIALGLQMRVLYPGLIASDKGGDGVWFSGRLVIVKGGLIPGKNAYAVQKGENFLLRDNGRTIVMDWQVLHFEKARFKKNPAGPFGCRRKYDKY
ncbi:hypothetical protein KKI24_28955 [bacterium]|nr:hypothetical protein [bacterium]